MIKKHRRKFLFTGVALACILWSSGGGGIAQEQREERPGLLARATADVKLREKPPVKGYIFIQGPGKEVALIKKGERVEILGEQAISTFFGKDLWVRVKKTNPSGKPVVGWAYWGAKKEEPVNFRLEE